MHLKRISILSLCFFLFFACKQDKSNAVGDQKEKEKESVSKFSLTPFSQSPQFDMAKLSSMAYKDKTFNFGVSDYELGAQTDDADSKMCANSGKGQHIHLIVNNEPYAAKYTNEFDYDLPDGTHHILAFLSRSYHESIKTDQAHLAEVVNVLDGTIVKSFPIKDPMLFYSRPKGTYIGKDTKKVMLDFYLKNTSISEGGNYVEANINGEIHEIYSWQPYYIEGLPMGDNYISLTLKDKEGEILKVPLNPVKRIFTLKEDPTPKE